MPNLARAFPLVFAALLALALGACSTAPRIQSAPSQAVLASDAGVTLPSHRCANYFLLDVRLNGRGPFTMILDTGAAQTVVTPRVADLLKNDARPVDMYAEGSQGKRQDVTRLVAVRDLVIGEASFHGFDAVVLELSKIQATLGTKIDGILGYPAFRDVLLTVDYPNSTLRVARGHLPPPDGRDIVELVGRDRPAVEARVNSRRRTMTIDTGKAGGFSLRDFDHEEFAHPPATIAMGVAVGGSYVLRAGRLAGDIQIGDFAFQRPVVDSSEASDLIGADALRSFAIVLDQSHRRMKLDHPGERTIQSPPVRGIGIGFDFSEGAWSVSQVFPGLPAEAAGIQPGDWVILLAGKRLRDLSCTRASELFEIGDDIDVAVVRQRRRLEFKVPIATLVP